MGENDDRTSHIRSDVEGYANSIKAPLYGKMNQVDIGIALCHLWLSLEHTGKVATFDFSKATAPDGYEFMVKVKVGSDS